MMYIILNIGAPRADQNGRFAEFFSPLKNAGLENLHLSSLSFSTTKGLYFAVRPLATEWSSSERFRNFFSATTSLNLNSRFSCSISSTSSRLHFCSCADRLSRCLIVCSVWNIGQKRGNGSIPQSILSRCIYKFLKAGFDSAPIWPVHFDKWVVSQHNPAHP